MSSVSRSRSTLAPSKLLYPFARARRPRPAPAEPLGGRGRAQLVQPFPPPAHLLGEAGRQLSRLRPTRRDPDRLSHAAPCTFTSWIGYYDRADPAPGARPGLLPPRRSARRGRCSSWRSPWLGPESTRSTLSTSPGSSSTRCGASPAARATRPPGTTIAGGSPHTSPIVSSCCPSALYFAACITGGCLIFAKGQERALGWLVTAIVVTASIFAAIHVATGLRVRYFVFLTPALAISLGVGLAWLASRGRWERGLVWLALAYCAASSLIFWFSITTGSRSPYP